MARDPTWSPDGTRLAFAFGDGIRVLPAAGGDPVELQPDGSHPAWSPDGTSIAFTRDFGGFSDLMIMDADGSDVRRLTDTPALFETDPAWRPDGTTIAYRRFRVDRDEVRLISPEGDSDLLVASIFGIRAADSHW